MKDLAAFSFEGLPINEGLIRSLHDGAFLTNHRNIVLVGGTGTGKTHLAITANVVRAGSRQRLGGLWGAVQDLGIPVVVSVRDEVFNLRSREFQDGGGRAIWGMISSRRYVCWTGPTH